MKSLVNLVVMCVIITNAFSQTYKRETIYSVISRKYTDTYLSYWRVLEGISNSRVNTFSLWGYKWYDYESESWNDTYFEVEYFKGEAKEVFEFLKDVNEFTDKFKNEEETIITYIKEVQVKTLMKSKDRYTYIYDKDRKLYCRIKQKQLADLLDKFISFCQIEGINYR